MTCERNFYLARRFGLPFLVAVKAASVTKYRIYRDPNWSKYGGTYPLESEWIDRKHVVYGPVSLEAAKRIATEWDDHVELTARVSARLEEARDARCAAIVEEDARSEMVAEPGGDDS